MNDKAVATEVILLEAEREIDRLKAVIRELLCRLAKYESNDLFRELEDECNG